MTASPDPHVGLPSEEEAIAAYNAVWQSAPGIDAHNVEIVRREAMAAVFSLIRPAFEAKERAADLAAQRAIGAEAARDALLFDAKTEQGRALVAMEDRALSAEAKLTQAVGELSGLQQAILDAAVICDDDEKAGDRLDKLARAIRALSAEAKLAQAVEALEPFAEAASLWENNTDDADLWSRPLHLAERIKARLTVGALRRARSASATARGETNADDR